MSVRDEPLGLLARLAADPNPSVRSFLAMNEHLPTEVLALLALLAADSEARVRLLVIQSWRDVPDDVRRMLLTDADPGICVAVRGQPSFPRTSCPGCWQIRRPAAAAAHAVPATELAADPDSDVREVVAAHPYLPPGLRDLLAGDRDIFVPERDRGSVGYGAA
ncbi:hypothetical protein [Streptomyces sp. NPDC056544]|uniref:hypothetical protein n=1 Tax=unclassified Streptomyces TaxID=2593676 RepID=UPI0036AB85FB